MQQLFAYAKEAGIRIKFGSKKSDAIDAFIANNISPEDIAVGHARTFSPIKKQEEDHSEVFDESLKVFVKMNRSNNLFEFDGYRFSKEHPYVIMNKGVARNLVSKYEGFSFVDAQEVKGFYS